MKLETDLRKIEKIAKKKDDENWAFRTYLKGNWGRDIDPIVHRLYEEVSAQIDCTTCGNCCKGMSPVLSAKDIEVFSEGLGMPVSQFKPLYLTVDMGDTIFNQTPCPFLKDNKCRNYEHRPAACQSYPHLHKEDFTTRLFGVLNYAICPIVFNVYEQLKDEVWNRHQPNRFNGSNKKSYRRRHR